MRYTVGMNGLLERCKEKLRLRKQKLGQTHCLEHAEREVPGCVAHGPLDAFVHKERRLDPEQALKPRYTDEMYEYQGVELVIGEEIHSETNASSPEREQKAQARGDYSNDASRLSVVLF